MNWKEESTAQGQSALLKEFKFKDFVSAWGFMNRVALIAEKMDHHPDICIKNYKNVTISTTTHDAGNKLTDKDYRLAKAIDKLL